MVLSWPQTETFKSLVRATVPRGVRNSLRSPSKLAAWVWDSTRFSFGGKNTLRLLPDWSVVCHPQAYRAIRNAQVLDQAQREEFLSFVSHCSDRMFLFDIGAHFGIFSLAAAHFGGTAVAVDPSPTATRMIEVQAKINGLASGIQIIRTAVSDTTGEIEMLSSGLFSYGYLKVSRGRPKRELMRVKTTTVDRMAEQFGAPTHVKVDVEGHELSILRGARATLMAYSPVLFLELHNDIIVSEGANPCCVLDELARLGYLTLGFDGNPIERHAILDKPISRIVARAASAGNTNGGQSKASGTIRG